MAEGAADGRRPAADQQRRRHHQLRDAADRPAAARVRPRPRRRRRAVVRRASDGEQVTTLDDQARTLDADDAASSTTPTGPTSIAGVMGGERSEVSADTTRVLMEVANWNGPNIHAHVAQARPAQRGLRALREGPRARAGAWTRRRSPRALMVELAGARLVPGTIDVGGAGPEPPVAAPARGAGRARCSASPIPRDEQCRDPAGARLRRGGRRRRARRDGAVLAPRGRHARGGPRSRRSRACDGVDETSPRRCPSRKRRDRRADPRAAGAPPRGGRARRPRPLRDRRLELRRRARCSTVCACPATTRCATSSSCENPMSEDQAILRPTILGSLLDAARRNVARGHARPRGCSSPRAVVPARRRHAPEPRRRAPRARRAAAPAA